MSGEPGASQFPRLFRVRFQARRLRRCSIYILPSIALQQVQSTPYLAFRTQRPATASQWPSATMAFHASRHRVRRERVVSNTSLPMGNPTSAR